MVTSHTDIKYVTDETKIKPVKIIIILENLQLDLISYDHQLNITYILANANTL